MSLKTDADEITLIADPKVLAIPIHENNEPMVDLKNQTILVFGTSPEVPNNTNYTKMRKTVYEKLVQAQSLLPTGIRFCLYEAYRSLELQKKLFDERYNKVKKAHATWTHEAIFHETIKLVSPIINLDNSINIPPHATGAAIDVYLLDAAGKPLDMGMHPQDWVEDQQGELSKTEATCIPQEARHNRQLMSHALEQVGFANYPTEFWHWSYGDRYWAYQTGANVAVYGMMK